jgi:hypothetical protein
VSNVGLIKLWKGRETGNTSTMNPIYLQILLGPLITCFWPSWSYKRSDQETMTCEGETRNALHKIAHVMMFACACIDGLCVPFPLWRCVCKAARSSLFDQRYSVGFKGYQPGKGTRGAFPLRGQQYQTGLVATTGSFQKSLPLEHPFLLRPCDEAATTG